MTERLGLRVDPGNSAVHAGELGLSRGPLPSVADLPTCAAARPRQRSCWLPAGCHRRGVTGGERRAARRGRAAPTRLVGGTRLSLSPRSTWEWRVAHHVRRVRRHIEVVGVPEVGARSRRRRGLDPDGQAARRREVARRGSRRPRRRKVKGAEDGEVRVPKSPGAPDP